MKLSRLLVGVLATALLLAVVPVSPADAREIVISPPPGAGTGGGGGSAPGGGGVGIVCTTWPVRTGVEPADPRGITDRNRNNRPDLGDWPFELVFDVYPGCFGYSWTGAFRHCPTGFEVWRFYGTIHNPVQSMTVSRINVPYTSCEQFPVFVMALHPDDNPATVVGSGVPWREHVSFGRSDRYQEAPIATTTIGGTRVFTTNPPFRRLGSACHALHSPNTQLRRLFWGGDLYHEPGAATLRDAYTARWNHDALRENRGLANLFNDVGGVDPHGQPILPDGFDCGSPRDFAVEIQPDQNPWQVGQRRLAGYCFVPLQREAEQYDLRMSGQVLDRWFEFRQAGFRASREAYAPYPDARMEDAANPNPVYRHALDQYRFWVSVEAYTRNLDGVRTPTIHSDGRLPDNAGALRDGVRCRVTAGDVFSRSTSGDGGGGRTDGGDRALPAGSGVELVVTTPDAGAVGGQSQPATTITTRPGALICAGTPCQIHPVEGPFLVSVNPALSVTDTGGSDWYERPDGGAFRPDGSGVGTWGLGFTSPTDPGRQFVVSASGTAVVETFTSVETFTEMCDRHGSCQRFVTTDRAPVRQTVPLLPRYVPDDRFPVVSGTSTPTEGRGGNR